MKTFTLLLILFTVLNLMALGASIVTHDWYGAISDLSFFIGVYIGAGVIIEDNRPKSL